MSGTSDTVAAGPQLFVPRSENTTYRWLHVLGRIQDALLLVWIAFVSFLPQNIYGLFVLQPLAVVWALVGIVAIWHFVRVPASRRRAAWVIAALPLAVAFVLLLSNTVRMPLVGMPAGRWLFSASLVAFPLYWLARWLLRTTSPQPKYDVRKRLTTTILLAVTFMLMLQALFLVWVPLSGFDFALFKKMFGSDWYMNLLMTTLGAAAIIAIGAIPYIILGFLRGSAHKGALVGIFVCLAITALCTFGVLAFFALMSYG